MARQASDGEWKSTACILCSLNCGVKVQLSEDGSSIARTKGDEEHPASKGRQGDQDDKRHENSCDSIHELLHGRFTGLGVLDEMNDLARLAG